jgi:ankyrin repeat protein
MSKDPLHVQLIVAVRYNNTPRIRSLLAQGAKVNSRHNSHHMTALAHATSSRRNTLTYLINRGATVNARDDDGRTPLMWAIIHGREDNVLALLEAGANINARDQNGVTPLMWAVFNRRTQIVRLLLSRGARLNARTNNGRHAMNFINMPMAPGGYVQPMRNNAKNELQRLLIPLNLHSVIRRELGERKRKRT